MKINDLVPMVEYFRTTSLNYDGRTKVRIDENKEYQFWVEASKKWVFSSASYNELMNSTFEPCEWVPKLGEIYYSPDYSEYEVNGIRYLCTPCHFLNDINDYQIKNNVGWYKTPNEAHAKSLEMGWTL